jgi:hypothetical protein
MINQARFSIDPVQAPPGWRLIENTAIYLSPISTSRFIETHSKACGMVGLERMLYSMLLCVLLILSIFGIT